MSVPPRPLVFLCAVALVCALAGSAPAADSDLDFFQNEAQVVTAARRQGGVSDAPATVYVVTGSQLRETGALTLWEALRGVPGLDIISARAMHGEVGIRGLVGPLNNRTLVMLDGRTVLNGFFDFVVWEEIPVSLDEIDRVEIVEGPVSALYGPNALSGVINIITKRPEDVGRAAASVTGGDRGLLFGSAMHGQRIGPWAYKVDLQRRAADNFESPSSEASQIESAHGLAERDLGEMGKVSLSGGITDHRVEIDAGSVGALVDDGSTGFLRGDWTRDGSKLRAFWNTGRTTFRQPGSWMDMDYDTFDVEASQAFSPSDEHSLVFGANYRRNDSRSSTLYVGSGHHYQDLWALFGEESWTPIDPLRVDVDARVDRHPLTGYQFSPRGAILWFVAQGHTLRASAGTAYRNPTLVENYISLTQSGGGASFTTQGNADLQPERIAQYELAYLGEFGRAKLRASVFHYRLREQITFVTPVLVSAAPPAFVIPAHNIGGIRAVGAEAQVQAPLAAGLAATTSWSIEKLRDDSDASVTSGAAPRNKVSGALSWRRDGWSATSAAHWVGRTEFRSNSAADAFVQTESVPDYWLLDARLARSFSGKLSGLTVSVEGQNLADRRHFELLGTQSGAEIRRRVAGTLSYRFP